MTQYLVYDVFTQEHFDGNPLAVIPDASHLTENQLLPITREFNFSETTFVYPPEDTAHDAKVRIFTPSHELAFAGHPTIGTALALSDLGRVGSEMVFELGVGPIPVTVGDGRARFVTRVPLATSPAPNLAALADCVGLPAEAFCTDRHHPETASLGTEFVFAELVDLAELNSAHPDVDAFRRAAGPNADRLAVFLYCRDGNRIDARMFQPLGGISEDPATGSAAAALAAYLGRLDGASQVFDISQGVKMGRPSRIEACVEVGNVTPVAVTIAGHAVKVMEGCLTL